ncbi:hypothetical protein AYJ57_20125 [Salipiger sp. CCB-MM3]|uniref:GntR family transcriptional regulator n=1 Tax=Salipiger sp. CCB-MM3 TaxID=1792508 RepID=UPI00080AC0EC|nr:GntR family transcriptional regulator [Salipiger sp. CCB-MM3]ANT62684.1 hypothetical protein AYJ57_20125 [Salipiger sp. CCB-MM3]
MQSRPDPALEFQPVNPDSPVPAYLQVEDDLRRSIQGAMAPEGTRLPREIELAEAYGVSRVTLRNALRRLEEAGFIERVHGRGTIVKAQPAPLEIDLTLMQPIWQQIQAQGERSVISFLSRESCALPASVAMALGQPEGEQGFRLVRLVSADIRPLVINTSWLPAALMPGFDPHALLNKSVWSTLSEAFKLTPSRSRNRVGMIQLSSDQAVLLQRPLGSQGIEMESITFDQQERPIELSRLVWGDAVRLTLNSAPMGQG